MKPRVVLVSHTYTAPVNRAKLEALAQYISLTVIVPNRWRETLFTVDAVTRMTSSSYPLHPLPIYFSGHVLRYVYPFRVVKRILRDAHPDLVCVEEEPASFALAQVALLKRDYKLIFFTWENIYRRERFPILERWNLARCDGAICGNRDGVQVMRTKKFAKPVAVTPQLGVDPEIFHPARSSSARTSLGLDGFVVGYVGRLVEEKGLWTVLRAVECLPDVRLAIIGSGPLRNAMERWIELRHLAERVRIIAAVPHQEIPHCMNAIDALVLPSQTTPRWKEQFGHVLIEAMACGVPVIGSDSGAIPEVIADAGIIFPESNIDALRDVIVALQMNTARRAHLADTGRARVLAHYTHSRIAAQNAQFFEQVLAQ